MSATLKAVVRFMGVLGVDDADDAEDGDREEEVEKDLEHFGDEDLQFESLLSLSGRSEDGDLVAVKWGEGNTEEFDSFEGSGESSSNDETSSSSSSSSSASSSWCFLLMPEDIDEGV